VRFDFESKSFDTTHCVCKDKFVGDLCETLIGGLSGDREQFVAAVTKCLEVDPVHGNCPDSEYGVMSEWDVSLVKDFSYAFSGQTTFNADISAWDTQSAESFEGTFNECGAFNQDLSQWKTASVTSIHGMFSAASAFDSDLSGWVTSKITDMSYAFSMAHSFKGVG
jgi:surface protein